MQIHIHTHTNPETDKYTHTHTHTHNLHICLDPSRAGNTCQPVVFFSSNFTKGVHCLHQTNGELPKPHQYGQGRLKGEKERGNAKGPFSTPDQNNPSPCQSERDPGCAYSWLVRGIRHVCVASCSALLICAIYLPLPSLPPSSLSSSLPRSFAPAGHRTLS